MSSHNYIQDSTKKKARKKPRIFYLFFELARVDNINHVVDGKAGLSNVGGIDNLAGSLVVHTRSPGWGHIRSEANSQPDTCNSQDFRLKTHRWRRYKYTTLLHR